MFGPFQSADEKEEKRDEKRRCKKKNHREYRSDKRQTNISKEVITIKNYCNLHRFLYFG